MEPVFAFFAQSAGYLKDGRLCIFGADFDSIEASEFPLPAVPFTFVAKLSLNPSEPLEGHTFRVDHIAPEGNRTPLSKDAPLKTKRNPRNPQNAAGAALVLTLYVAFHNPGRRPKRGSSAWRQCAYRHGKSAALKAARRIPLFGQHLFR